MFADVRAKLGGLDVLVNNAGVAGPTGGVEEISPADWRRTIDVCLTGQFLCAHFAVPMLKAAGGGSIVNLSSAAGRFGYAYRTPYSAAKWGVIGFSQSLAKELGPANIRVNAILPGIVEGPRMSGVIAARAKQVGVSYAEMEKTYLDRVSLRRMVTAEDVAATVLFLVSEAGAQHVRSIDRRRRQCRKSMKGNACGQGLNSRNRFYWSRLGDQLRAGGT